MNVERRVPRPRLDNLAVSKRLVVAGFVLAGLVLALVFDVHDVPPGGASSRDERTPATTECVNTVFLMPGATKQVPEEPGYDGIKVENFRIISKPGQPDTRERFSWTYQMRPKKVFCGVATPAPPATPAPTPAAPGTPPAASTTPSSTP